MFRQQGREQKVKGRGNPAHPSSRPSSALPLSSACFIRLLFCLGLLVAAVGCAAPGEGKKAEAGYALCEPLIDALALYYDDHGAYPDTLEALAPDYVETVPETYDNFPLEYQPTETGYTLQFSYQRPGMNECVYTPDTGWGCSGYF